MLITPHALFGAALMKKTDSFLWGAPLAFASHFLLDAVPNWDVGLTSIRDILIIMADGMTAFLLLALLSRREASRGTILIWTGAFFGLLPDFLSQSCAILGIQEWNPLESFHQSIQKSAPWAWSLPAQVLLSVILVAWMWNKSR